MFTYEKSFDLMTEKRVIVLTDDSAHPHVKAVLKALGEKAEDLVKNTVNRYRTFGKLKAKEVVFIRTEDLDKPKKRLEAAKGVMGLKEDFIIDLNTFPENRIADWMESLVRGGYRFDKFKTDDKENITNAFYTAEKDVDAAVHEGIVVGEAANHVRDLVNTPYNYLNATDLAEYAQALEAIDNVKVTILDKAACEAMNMGAYLGVNKGSIDEPKLIHIEYTGNPDSEEITALIGKGVMFDTGGYSLKGVQHMPTMKMDMGGAATVLGAIEAIARLKANANVSVVIAATDNRIGDYAIVPDDILTSAKGLTIEIISTDAEGRLTLADALWFAQEKGATRMIDVATLTGAVVGALGKTYTGAFTNNDAFLNQLIQTSKDAGENIWQLPVHEDHHEAIKSDVADMKNSGGRMAGSSVAAAFLEKFVDDNRPWVHLDIAGTAYVEKEGATGTLVKTLTKLFI